MCPRNLLVFVVAAALAGCRADSPPDVLGENPAGEPTERAGRGETVPLRYHGRDLDVTTQQVKAVPLEYPRAGSPSKRIRIEKLTVTLDLTPSQWQSVFERWFPMAAALPVGIDLHATPVVIAGISVLRYTCAAAPFAGQHLSRFWRVYLIPDWRSALVIRSEGWSPADRDRYREMMDEVTAEAVTKKSTSVWVNHASSEL